MSNRNNVQIRAAIDQARALEAQTHSLKQYVDLRIDILHRSIYLPSESPTEYLIDFLTRYIQHVPDFLDALASISERAGIYDAVERFIDIAQAYFVHPPEMIDDHGGLHSLIDEAYLAHRLMEEVNDRVMLECGIPLIPMNLTRSNIIVHHLLGETFANQLDHAIHYTVNALFFSDQLMGNGKFSDYITLHKTQGWSDILREWPCLASDAHIELRFKSNPSPLH